MKKSNLLSPVFPKSDHVFMNTITVSGVEIDICPLSGGIWFDRFELDNFDEAHEDISKIMSALPEKVTPPKIMTERHCPRHPEITMMSQPFGPKGVNGVLQVDICGKCAGIWLDYSEINKIRELYPTAELKKKLSEAFVNDVFKNNAGIQEAVAHRIQKPIPSRVQFVIDLLSKIGI
jgi:Zn-finger nucleic acid-binding protein